MGEDGVSLGCPDQGSVPLSRRVQQVVEGLESGDTTWDKTMIEIKKKLAQLTLGTGLGELLDHSNLGREWMYAVLIHVVAQQLQGSIELDAVVL